MKLEIKLVAVEEITVGDSVNGSEVTGKRSLAGGKTIELRFLDGSEQWFDTGEEVTRKRNVFEVGKCQKCGDKNVELIEVDKDDFSVYYWNGEIWAQSNRPVVRKICGFCRR